MLMCRIFDPGHLESFFSKRSVYFSYFSHFSAYRQNSTQTANNDLQNRDFKISLFYYLSEPKQWK